MLPSPWAPAVARRVIPPSAGTTRCLVTIKRAMAVTYRAQRKERMVRHLAEFERRFVASISPP